MRNSRSTSVVESSRKTITKVNERRRSQTHCKRGHPYFGENLYLEGDKRRCKACHRAAQVKRLARNRQLVQPCPKPPRQVYILKNHQNGLFKIGLSSNPLRRAATLRSEEPEIELVEKGIGGFSLENRLHRHFAPYRVRGEWFRLDENSLREAIVMVVAG